MKKINSFLSLLCLTFGVISWCFFREDAEYWVYFLLLAIYLKIDED
jgi:hypothetical protein